MSIVSDSKNEMDFVMKWKKAVEACGKQAIIHAKIVKGEIHWILTEVDKQN